MERRLSEVEETLHGSDGRGGIVKDVNVMYEAFSDFRKWLVAVAAGLALNLMLTLIAAAVLLSKGG